MKKIIAGVILTGFIGSVSAESVIITQTNTWKSVPITVDETKHTYTVAEGIVVPESDFYYTYSGYRCVTTKITAITDEPVILKPSANGTEIYCYKE